LLLDILTYECVNQEDSLYAFILRNIGINICNVSGGNNSSWRKWISGFNSTLNPHPEW